MSVIQSINMPSPMYVDAQEVAKSSADPPHLFLQGLGAPFPQTSFIYLLLSVVGMTCIA
jgi:hypothetical protein